MTDLSSAPAGYRFPREVIAVAVRWYLRYGLSYRDVRTCWPNAASTSITSPFTGGCRPSRPSSSKPHGRRATRPGIRWFVDETYIKVAGRWTYLYRAVDQRRQLVTCRLSSVEGT